MGLFGRDGGDCGDYDFALEDAGYFAANKGYGTEVVYGWRFCLDSEPCYNQRRRNDGFASDERHNLAIPELRWYEHDVRSFCRRHCFTNIRMDNKESNRRR